MARIRTIKPEFWTDEVIVQLPFEARLLFIGLWNFADDYGGLQDSPDRIRMQVFPGDARVDVEENIDLLCAAGLLDRYVDERGEYALCITKWSKHQKVDNPGKVRTLGESYRKLAIPSEARRALAIKYGCQPGERKDVTCYHCGIPGAIHWFRLASGKPSAWVTFPGLEMDHVEPEASGGSNSSKNLVLACRSCNRSRGTTSIIEFASRRMIDSPIEKTQDSREDYPSPHSGREGKGREGAAPEERSPKPTKPRKTRRPSDFTLTPELLGYITTHLPAADPQQLFAKFCEQADAKGWEYVDWPKALQTYVRNAKPDSGHFSAGQYPRRSLTEPSSGPDFGHLGMR